MRVNTFVGRENELSRLQHFLEKASAGEGQICFVAGEAGVGKSALVHEFVRRAEEAEEIADGIANEKTEDNLVAAAGQCNAQTGAGDAYLPFREVLTLLTGVQEAK